MILNLLHRCFIKNLNFTEHRYRKAYIKSFDVINLLDDCLIYKQFMKKISNQNIKDLGKKWFAFSKFEIGTLGSVRK
ncbi:MAG: hypothetical protein A2513_00610 [Sulfurimonas sp. RIFOXYD12_FULL_33_39]|uniref:hypothetical protein n=1 Tax=Sulfurimonas sp. RIFOXYD12_FULL_33_39 TaxID=1802259 RepID=UPI0008D034D1|nr:hypothetical protein [Sulfurimonas sp. RIFOXYD12_FULL_33_39]OHE10826.1 MAG: hypothetical protein A2513_00610 [Sulfurimonas sp. RIFOXYD12_FULL_33_39]OHE13404.1 MAG: hypothetical protein A2530_07570 [Sulfurimonas sp. RIFOXYD2_FULL_34_21]DAB28748.1 MAG TPA: hypothetical protein CFH78_00665 [Sulfurimonas sp. UBA10385]